MTNREFFEAIINANINDELTAHAKDAIQKLDARNAKRSSKPSKTAIANEPVKAMVLAYLAEHKGALTSEVGAGVEISTQKASALLRQLVADGKVTVADVKVPKKGTMKAYSIVE